MSFGIGRDFAGALAPQIDGKLRPYLRQALCSVVAVGSGAETGQVRVRLPGEDVATADLPWAPVYGAVPIVNDVVRTLWDHASRFVVTTSAGGGSGQAIGAFSARMATDQLNIPTNTVTKVLYDAEDYDVSGWYDPVLARYTPQVAGYYQFTAWINITPAVDGTRMYSTLFKNGVDYARIEQAHAASTSAVGGGGSIQAFANGTTDYFELWMLHNLGVSTSDISASDTIKWSGFYIGSA